MTSVSTEIVTGAFVTKQAKPRRRGGDGASPAMDRRGATRCSSADSAAAAAAAAAACMQHVLGGRNEPRFLKFSVRNDFHAQRYP